MAAIVHDLPTTGLRYFNVYGPRQRPDSPYSGVISIFLRQRRLTQHRLHVIDGGVAIAALDPTTRVLADGRTLEHLRGLGRAAATAWLEADG